MLDGHEVGEMERQFLMNWKAMRKARRRQQKRSLEQIPYYQINEKASVPLIFHDAGPAPPLTLPALPARQLPHRCKKVMYQEHSVRNNLDHCEEIEGGFDDFKLPELVPYHQSIITQQGNLMSKEKLWRTIEVGTGNIH